jgi:hypothetical protein
MSPPWAPISPGTEPVAVVLDALGAPRDPELDALLGDEAAARLRGALLERALDWARVVAAPRRARHVHETAELDALLAGHDGPVVLAAPDVPGLDAALGRQALDDLAAGCAVVFGAAHDARPYLLATPRPSADLAALVGTTFLRGGVLAGFAELGGTLGLLRSERRLASAGDARALALDPLAPGDLAGLLAGLRPVPRR